MKNGFSWATIIILASILLISACGDGNKKLEEGSDASISQNQKEESISELNQIRQSQLPPLSKEWAERLFNTTTYLDFIFYNVSYTLSMNESQSIKQFISGIGTKHVFQDKNCPSQGRIFFQEEGNVFMEADIHYIENQCAYLVFFIGNKAMFANELNDSGKEMFRNYLGSGQQNIRNQVKGN
jgi:hypothetical protein